MAAKTCVKKELTLRYWDLFTRRREFGMVNAAASDVSQIKIYKIWAAFCSNSSHVPFVFPLAAGKNSCTPKLTSINVTIDNCITVMRMPVCWGHCVSEPWWEETWLFFIVTKANYHTSSNFLPLIINRPWFIHCCRIVLLGGLQVEHKYQCCKEQRSERRPVTLQCSDLTSRRYTYNHITSCECRPCLMLRWKHRQHEAGAGNTVLQLRFPNQNQTGLHWLDYYSTVPNECDGTCYTRDLNPSHIVFKQFTRQIK